MAGAICQAVTGPSGGCGGEIISFKWAVNSWTHTADNRIMMKGQQQRVQRLSLESHGTMHCFLKGMGRSRPLWDEHPFLTRWRDSTGQDHRALKTRELIKLKNTSLWEWRWQIRPPNVEWKERKESGEERGIRDATFTIPVAVFTRCESHFLSTDKLPEDPV